jgi:L-amino acid N-acyltransferase YncA
MKVVVANPLHAADMASILNDIIAAGGTTALTKPVTSADMKQRLSDAPANAAWHVAERDDGFVLGFQWIEPADYLPAEAADIATFARIGHTGHGVGSSLFKTTRHAATTLGYRWINANIRADNTSGLAYYQSRGFEDYGRQTNVRLSNGQTVDKVLKRFDL